MRLGQLARQLEVKPEKIISFLEKEKDIIIKSHPNSKVEDELIAVITDYFKPAAKELEEGVAAEDVSDDSQETPVKVVAKTEEDVSDDSQEVIEPEHIETIKPEAPPELKIVGKIDLPDKSQINVEVDGVIYDQETLDNKKKEELAEDRERKAEEKEVKQKEEEEKRVKAREQRKVEQERKAMLETEKNNLLSKEEEKKKAIILKEQQERERILEEKRKANQAAHYAKNFSKPASPKKKKNIEKQLVEGQQQVEGQQVEQQEEEVREKSAFKRFIKWLNT